VFPKGFIGDHIQGETKEATAIREVQEETGIIGQILQPLTPVTYFTKWMGLNAKKLCIIFSWSMQVEIQKIMIWKWKM